VSIFNFCIVYSNYGCHLGAIPGTPGDDYPIFAEVPETAFLCDGQVGLSSLL
jgi:hypothetical protein